MKENDSAPTELVTMDFENTARIARNILSESGWDANTDNWFRHNKMGLDFKINPEDETFTLEQWQPKCEQVMTVKEAIDFLENWKG